MSPTGHDQDRLLDYAYGELSPPEVNSLEAHLKSCPQCTRALEDIRKVRRTMAQLPTVPAPAAGLGSLLAYAQQAARRAQAGPTVHSRLWKWVLLPGTGALAMVLLIVVTSRVADETRLARLRYVAPSKVPPASPTPEPEPSTLERLAAEAPRSDAASAAKPADSTEEKQALAAKPADSTKEKQALAAKPADSVKEKQAPAKAESKHAREVAQSVDASLEGAARLSIKRAAPPARAVSPTPDERAASPQATLGAQPPTDMQVGSAPSGSKDESENPPGRSPLAKTMAQPKLSGAAPAIVSADRRMPPDALDREIARVQQVLKTQTLAKLERAWLLNHLCELLYAANRRSEAESTCEQVIRDYPDSAAADAARRLKAKNPPSQAR